MKTRLRGLFISLLAALISISVLSTPVFAVPDNDANTTETSEEKEEKISASTKTILEQIDEVENQTNINDEDFEKPDCYKNFEALGWIICPSTGLISKIVDSLYSQIESILLVDPIESRENHPIRMIWSYFRNLTNLFFIILILIIVLSHVTGFGINNYNIKRMLPRIIIAAILANLSYIVCQLAVDLSNIIGNSLYQYLKQVEEYAMNGAEYSSYAAYSSFEQIIDSIIGVSGAVGVLSIVIAMNGGWAGLGYLLLVVAFSGAISLIAAIVTIAARQALIYLLIMVSPLAIVAYMLPNTEGWYKKWYKTFTQMLVFYPMFAGLMGITSITSFVVFTSATDGLGVILSLAIRVVPLFLAVPMLKMSNSVLGGIGKWFDRTTAPAKGGLMRYARDKQEQSRQRALANKNPLLPSTRLMQALEQSKSNRMLDIEKHANTNKTSYNARSVERLITRNRRGQYMPTALGARYLQLNSDLELSKASQQKIDAINDAGFEGVQIPSARRATIVSNAQNQLKYAKEEAQIALTLRDVTMRQAVVDRANYFKADFDSNNSALEARLHEAFNITADDDSERAAKLRDQSRNAILATVKAEKKKAESAFKDNMVVCFDDYAPGLGPKHELEKAFDTMDYNRMEAAIEVIMNRGDTDFIKKVLIDKSSCLDGTSTEKVAMRKHLMDTLIRLKEKDLNLQTYAKANMMRNSIYSDQMSEHGDSALHYFIDYDSFNKGIRMEGDSDAAEDQELINKVSMDELFNANSDNSILQRQERTAFKGILDDLKSGRINMAKKGKLNTHYSMKQLRTAAVTGMDGEKLDALNALFLLDFKKLNAKNEEDLDRFWNDANKGKHFKKGTTNFNGQAVDINNAEVGDDIDRQAHNYDLVYNGIEEFFRDMSENQLCSIKSATIFAMNDALLAIDRKRNPDSDITEYSETFINETGETMLVSKKLKDILRPKLENLQRPSNYQKNGMNPSVRKMLGLG